MSIFAKNLEFLMKKKGVNAYQIQEETGSGGITQSTTQRILKGDTANPNFRTVKKYAGYFGVDPHDLQSRNLNSEEVDNIATHKPQSTTFAPIINWVQAGEFTDIAENGYDEWKPVEGYTFGTDLYWLRIKGDSMEPEYKEGDLILVHAGRQPVAGNFVIAQVEGQEQATFKRYKPCGLDDKTNKEYFQLIALNDFYAPIDSRVKRFTVTGVVVKHERNLI